MLIGLPRIYGCWHMILVGFLQHGGLAEDVLDHRLNSRTVLMNPVSRWLYWNMNYHVEHHMFPMVPYHALPKLHAMIKHDLPVPDASMWAAYKDMVLSVMRQRRERGYYLRRALPATALPRRPAPDGSGKACAMTQWIDVCALDDIDAEDVLRWDHAGRTYAIYYAPDGKVFATDGLCTH